MHEEYSYVPRTLQRIRPLEGQSVEDGEALALHFLVVRSPYFSTHCSAP